MFSEIGIKIIEIVEWLGYPGIIFFMALESSFFPFPSEIVMIPAGWLVSEGKMSVSGAIISGIIGSWLGAILNYYLALYLGRPLLIKYARFFSLTEEKFYRVESFFRTHGEIGTFTGRLIPFIRQYISFPAGLVKMHFGKFIFYTGLGAGIWVTVLVYIGYYAGRNKELIKRYSNSATFALIVFAVVILLVYSMVYTKKRRS